MAISLEKHIYHDYVIIWMEPMIYIYQSLIDFVVMSFHNFIKISLADLLGTQRNAHTYGDVLAPKLNS